MSAQVRQYIDMLMKGAIVVLLAVCGYFLERTHNKVEVTYDSAIRLEVKVNSLERQVNSLEEEIKRVRK